MGEKSPNLVTLVLALKRETNNRACTSLTEMTEPDQESGVGSTEDVGLRKRGNPLVRMMRKMTKKAGKRFFARSKFSTSFSVSVFREISWQNFLRLFEIMTNFGTFYQWRPRLCFIYFVFVSVLRPRCSLGADVELHF
jgi:hypothetical protein